MKNLQVGDITPNGYRILARYRNLYVLAQCEIAPTPEPYVIWNLDSDGDTVSGNYFSDREAAEKEFCSRCFSWYPVQNRQREVLQANNTAVAKATYTQTTLDTTEDQIILALKQAISKHGIPETALVCTYPSKDQ